MEPIEPWIRFAQLKSGPVIRRGKVIEGSLPLSSKHACQKRAGGCAPRQCGLIKEGGLFFVERQLQSALLIPEFLRAGRELIEFQRRELWLWHWQSLFSAP